MASNYVSMLNFSYDSRGNEVKAKADCIATARTFDGVGNCVSVAYPGGAAVQYTYDAVNQISAVDSSLCLGCVSSRVASYAYDAPDRLSKITGVGLNTRIVYDGVSGVANAPGDFGWQQVSLINFQIAGGTITPVDRRAFSYDRVGNKTSRAQTTPFVQGQ